MQNKIRLSASQSLVLTAIMSALLVAGKFALSWIPNIEIVTLFIFVFTASFGFLRTFAATLIFVLLDMVIYPFSPDVAVSYAIYYPLVCLIAYLMSRQNNEIITASVGAAVTLSFGFLTSAAAILLGIVPGAYWTLYLAGIVLYAIHVVSNFIVLMFAYKPLCKALQRTLKRIVKKPAQDTDDNNNINN